MLRITYTIPSEVYMKFLENISIRYQELNGKSSLKKKTSCLYSVHVKLYLLTDSYMLVTTFTKMVNV